MPLAEAAILIAAVPANSSTSRPILLGRNLRILDARFRLLP